MNITIGLFCLVNRSYDNPQSINQGLTWKSPAIITANRGWAATAQLIVMNVPLALLLVTSGFRSLWGCKKIPNHGRQDKKNEPYDNMVVPAILCVYNYVCIYTYIYIYYGWQHLCNLQLGINTRRPWQHQAGHFKLKGTKARILRNTTTREDH